MKNIRSILSYFITSSCIAFLALMYRDINGNIVKAFFIAIAIGLISMIIITIGWKPLLKFYLRNFDKNYRYNNYNMFEKKKQSAKTTLRGTTEK